MMTTGTIWRGMPADAIDALLRVRIEVAIRLVREAEQIGFQDAKRIVERYIRSDPTLLEFWSARREHARRVLRWWVRSVAVGKVLLGSWLLL